MGFFDCKNQRPVRTNLRKEEAGGMNVDVLSGCRRASWDIAKRGLSRTQGENRAMRWAAGLSLPLVSTSLLILTSSFFLFLWDWFSLFFSLHTVFCCPANLPVISSQL